MLHRETIEYAWEAPEFEFKEKNKYWYWFVGIIALFLIGVAIYFENYLFGFLILIGGFLMFRLSNKEPLILHIEASDHGVKIDEEFFPYNEIHAFWIGENKNNEPILLIATNKPITPIISVRIHPEIELMEMREYLLQFIDEHKIKEPLTNQVIDKIGF